MEMRRMNLGSDYRLVIVGVGEIRKYVGCRGRRMGILAESGFAYLFMTEGNWDGMVLKHCHETEVVEVDPLGEFSGVGLSMKLLNSISHESMARLQS
jgi:hypothetical protein